MYTLNEVISIDQDKTEYWNMVITENRSYGLTHKEYVLIKMIFIKINKKLTFSTAPLNC